VRLDGRALRHLAAADAQLPQPALSIAAGSKARAGGRRARSRALRELIDLNLYNSQNTLLIDLDRCTRCDECVRACADAHDGVTRFTRDGPRFGKYLVTLACRSCTDPKCHGRLPGGLDSARGPRSRSVSRPWCIGCQRCANQCPFGNINYESRCATPASGAAGPARRCAPRLCDSVRRLRWPNCVYACPHDAAIRVNPGSFLSATICGNRTGSSAADADQSRSPLVDRRQRGGHRGTRGRLRRVRCGTAGRGVGRQLARPRVRHRGYRVHGARRLLSARKRVRTWRIGSAQAWMRVHIWLGLIAVPCIWFHSGFALGRCAHTFDHGALYVRDCERPRRTHPATVPSGR
jgi:Fe-S-cluster-containing dehydrogenase component